MVLRRSSPPVSFSFAKGIDLAPGSDLPPWANGSQVEADVGMLSRRLNTLAGKRTQLVAELRIHLLDESSLWLQCEDHPPQFSGGPDLPATWARVIDH